MALPLLAAGCEFADLLGWGICLVAGAFLYWSCFARYDTALDLERAAIKAAIWTETAAAAKPQAGPADSPR